jgi:hypothetical protein
MELTDSYLFYAFSEFSRARNAAKKKKLGLSTEYTLGAISLTLLGIAFGTIALLDCFILVAFFLALIISAIGGKAMERSRSDDDETEYILTKMRKLAYFCWGATLGLVGFALAKPIFITFFQ